MATALNNKTMRRLLEISNSNKAQSFVACLVFAILGLFFIFTWYILPNLDNTTLIVFAIIGLFMTISSVIKLTAIWLKKDWSGEEYEIYYIE